ncbi:MAG: hypothetical protein EOP86_20130 [Verrucomicrobiaceae bacterium]|nr:MAG: hypothetical protein EOP86_20130 [Verrucomicrobiaceae bacterium]
MGFSLSHISTAARHTVALLADGRMRAWGDNCFHPSSRVWVQVPSYPKAMTEARAGGVTGS